MEGSGPSSASSLSGRRFLVTGARGFLGSHLCRALLGRGAEVHGVTRQRRPAGGLRIRWWQQDLHREEEVLRLLNQATPDVVVHLSGHVTADPRLEFVGPTFESLLGDTVRLLTAASRAGCERMVLVGSLVEPELGPDEFLPGSPYVAAKWAASAYGRMFHALYGLPVVIVSPGMAYGPGQSENKLIPYVVRSLLTGQPPRLASGRLLADWIYVDDVIEGLVCAALHPGVEGASVDVGTGTLISVRDLVAELVRIVGTPIEPVFGARQDRLLERVRAADVHAARQTLGWAARTPLAEGLERTVSWYANRLG